MERLDVEELVRNRSSRPLGRSVGRRVSAAAAGNPFFALEMTQVLAAHSEATADGLLLPVAVTELLESRLRTLSPGTRQLLGAAALCADATVGVLVEAVAPADARELLREAEAAELINLGPASGGGATGERRVRFCHPLLADAIEASLTEPERVDLHRRLARVSSTEEENARHLAAATATPDELVAETLEVAAIRARRRGAPEVGAQLALAADRLTPESEPTSGQRRTLLAGDLCFAAGEPDQARTLLGRAAGGISSELAAEASVRLGRVEMFTGHLAPAVDCFEEVLGRGPMPPPWPPRATRVRRGRTCCAGRTSARLMAMPPPRWRRPIGRETRAGDHRLWRLGAQPGCCSARQGLRGQRASRWSARPTSS